MIAVRWVFGVLVALFVAAGSVTPAGRAAERGAMVFPFVKGTAWTYAGTLRWTVMNSNHVRTSRVRWTSEVVDAFDHGQIAGALLRGGVWDTAWWSPGQQPGSYLVLRAGARYYLVCYDAHMARETFRSLKASRRTTLPASAQNDPWFSVPLNAGQVDRAPNYGGRDDTWYSWVVERVVPAQAPVPGVPHAPHPGYLMMYRTLPDEETVTLVPGIGITAFTYLHHGTVAEAHLHLIAYRLGSGR